MEEIDKVGLGFAEFISQLLHETFEATLSTQQYQAEKYIELSESLNLSVENMFSRYFDDSDISNWIDQTFGHDVLNKAIKSEHIELLNSIGITENLQKNRKLSEENKTILISSAKTAIVNKRRELIEILVNKM